MCGIVGLLVKDRVAAAAARRTHGADADRHDRARSGLRRAGGVRRRGGGRSTASCSLYCAQPGFDWRTFEGAWTRARSVPRSSKSTPIIASSPPRSDHVAARGWISEQLSARARAQRRAQHRSLQGCRVCRPKSPSATASSTLSGTHLVGHTRMATESAVTPRMRIPSRPARTSAWCTTARCRIRQPAAQARAARRAIRNRQRHRSRLPLPRMAPALRRDARDGGRARLQRVRRLLHVPDGHAGQAGAGARPVRLQARGRRRDRRLRRHRLGVPLAGASAGRQARHRVRAEAGGDLLMVSAMMAAGRTRRVSISSGRRVRELNQFLHGELARRAAKCWSRTPTARTASRSASMPPVRVDIGGHAGYYAAGMNKHATVIVHGNAGPGVAENMMSGRVEVSGFASGGAARRRTAACWSSRRRRPALRHLAQGRRHRGRRRRRQLLGLHGAGRPHRDLRRRRRRARRLAVRSGDLRARQRSARSAPTRASSR